MMKRTNFLALSLTAASFVTALSVSADAAVTSTQLRVAAVDVVPHADKLTVTMNIDARAIKPGRDREVTFAPVVRAVGAPDSLELPVFKVCGRNRYYSHIRNNDLEDGDVIMEAGHEAPGVYTVTVPWQPWMAHSKVDLRESVAHCCDAPVYQPETPIAEIDMTTRTVESPARYVALTGDSTITREAEGRAFITFVVNKTYFKEDYMDNEKEYNKILNTIELVKNDRDAIITYISIKGFASPEGSYSNNVRLAMGRTQTLKEEVRKKFNFDPEIMHTDYEPEDWQGLIDWLGENEIAHRDEILAIASSDMLPDPRNEEIKRRFPKEYDYILKNVYPWLRHSDYLVRYNIRTYTDIEELKRLYAEDPTKLRPVDFQRIAALHPVDSREYKDVMMKAVEVWPYDELANINAANIVLERGFFKEAADYLSRAGQTAEAYYTRGALAARTGDFDQAISNFSRAAEMGLNVAADELERVEKLKNAPQVEYLLPDKVYTSNKK